MKRNLGIYFVFVTLALTLCACGEETYTFESEMGVFNEYEDPSNMAHTATDKEEEISKSNDIAVKTEVGEKLPDLSQAEKETYLAVLEGIEAKIALDEGHVDTGRGLFYDIDSNGCLELMLCYEYPEATLAFEVWTIIDGKAMQLAAISDLGSIAGAGDGGIHLVSYDDNEYLCFWTYNVEPWPPGRTLDQYNVSEWLITDGRLRSPRRMSVEFFAKSGKVDEALASFSVRSSTHGEISQEVCQAFLSRYIEEPKAVLCRSEGLDRQLGFTLAEMKMALNT